MMSDTTVPERDRDVDALGMTLAPRSNAAPFPSDMLLTPTSRHPIRLSAKTAALVMDRPVPTFACPSNGRAPLASIIVVTFNNLMFTRMCLESLLATTDYPNYEIQVIDNDSTDGTRDYLQELKSRHSQIHLVLNEVNTGFAAACNQGLQRATGEILVLLNNDTLVARGWLTRLAQHLQDAEIGLVGAATNRIGNEAEIATTYSTYGEFEQFASVFTREHFGERLDIRTAMMFCVALRRNVFTQIGPLDEQFGLGLFEDDDYSMRVRSAGLRVVCADDVFVHHFGQASFGMLAATGEYGTLFHNNQRRWEEKWNTKWEPHSGRLNPQYASMIERIRSIVASHLPKAAHVVVVTRGDDRLLQLDGRHTSHFPQSIDGKYPGYYPKDGAAATDQLDELRREGAEFFLLPNIFSWWLDYYVELRLYLETCCCLIVQQDDTCRIYSLPPVGRS